MQRRCQLAGADCGWCNVVVMIQAAKGAGGKQPAKKDGGKQGGAKADAAQVVGSIPL